MDIDQTNKYIDFLLNELNRYRKDFCFSSLEAQNFNNEIVRFKNLVSSSFWISNEIKSDIHKLNFSFNEVKEERKNLFFNMGGREVKDKSEDDKLRRRLENIEYDLNTIKRKIELLNC